MYTKVDLLDHLEKESRVLSNLLIRRAFRDIDRGDFVSEDYKPEAYEDYALPIGHDATISQPTTVAFMLELLNAKIGDRVLDVGSGSGWTSAMLANIVGGEGSVTALEIRPEIFNLGKKNAQKYAQKNLHFELANTGTVGKPGYKFDRILVSAAAEELPDGLIGQLEEEGVMVIPIGNSIWRIEKLPSGELVQKEYPGFVFVPLK